MTKLEQAARQALEAFPTMTEFFNRYVESIGGPYFSESDRIALLAVRALPRIEGALREALAHPKQDLASATRNGWVLREVLFSDGEPVGHREPQTSAADQEPVAYLYCGGQFGGELDEWEINPEQHQCDKLNEHHGAIGKAVKLPLYTTPQPARQPLTEGELDLILQKSPIKANYADLTALVRAVEKVHGIGGEA